MLTATNQKPQKVMKG